MIIRAREHTCGIDTQVKVNTQSSTDSQTGRKLSLVAYFQYIDSFTYGKNELKNIVYKKREMSLLVKTE